MVKYSPPRFCKETSIGIRSCPFVYICLQLSNYSNGVELFQQRPRSWKYWVSQKVRLGFSFPSYEKTERTLWPTQYFSGCLQKEFAGLRQTSLARSSVGQSSLHPPKHSEVEAGLFAEGAAQDISVPTCRHRQGWQALTESLDAKPSRPLASED